MSPLRDFFFMLPNEAKTAIVFAFLLFLPPLARRLRVPSIVALIVGGLILGPRGVALFQGHTPVLDFFADLGVLLLMFFAGFEIDPAQFSAARTRALLFGTLTSVLPFLAGFGCAKMIGLGDLSAALVGSLLASHTLIALPAVQAHKLLTRDSIVVAVGGTVITDISAMLILAICVPIHVSGFSKTGLAIQLIELAIYIPAVLIGLSRVAGFLLKRYGKTDDGKMTVQILLIALAACLAHLIHLEGVVGAFLIGIAMRRAVGSTFVAHSLDAAAKTLFIPLFFISTGTIIDPDASSRTLLNHPLFVLAMILGLVGAKFLASFICGLLCQFPPKERRLMWGLTLPQVSATLASAKVALDAKNPAGEGLINGTVFDAVIVLVLVTSILGPILTEKFSREVAAELPNREDDSPPNTGGHV